MKSRQTIYGKLNCFVVESSPPPSPIDLLVILCHGFGAPGDDLVPLAFELQAALPNLQVRYLFPQGPIDLTKTNGYGANAWWMIDWTLFHGGITSHSFQQIRMGAPDLLDQRFEELQEAISEALTEAQLREDRLILGGFSQGAILATETALRLPSTPAGLIIWSGMLINEGNWEQYATSSSKNLTIVQSHGRSDAILPFGAAKWLHDRLLQWGFKATLHAFVGPHTIPPSAIEMSKELLRSLTS